MTKQTSILVLPGMGDIYWVMVKLEGFIKKYQIENPVIYTWELQPHKNNRSADYIKRIPFVTYGGPWYHDQNLPEFNEIYFGTKWVIPNFQGFDYLISVNGILRNGYDLDSFGLSDFETNWYFPLTPSSDEDAAYKEYAAYGDYVVAYFTSVEMYQHWMRSITVDNIFTMLKQIHEQTGCKILLTGGFWDKGLADKIRAHDTTGFIQDLIGDTTIDQLFALIKRAKGMIGWCGGNTIKSVYFKTPTVILWSNYFPNAGFYEHSVPPDSIGQWHEIKVVERDSPKNIADAMVSLINNKKKYSDELYLDRISLYIAGNMLELEPLYEMLQYRTDGVAIDVGANVGEISYFLMKYGAVNAVHAFEPLPTAYNQLTGLESIGVVPYPVALSNITGTGKLTTPFIPDTPELNTGISTLDPTWIEQMHQEHPTSVSTETISVDVELKRLDDYNFTNVKFIKVDVEGHEIQVIEGATETIKRNKPIMLVEVSKKQPLFDMIVGIMECDCWVVHDGKMVRIERDDPIPTGTYNMFFVPTTEPNIKFSEICQQHVRDDISKILQRE